MAESIEDGFLEIYIRMNDDAEKDYCFTIRESTTFKDLHKITETLPINLSPSIFYHTQPSGFAVSVCPGMLTPDGGLLFTDASGTKKYLKYVDQNELVSDHAWPGQLIVPIWEPDYSRIYGILGLLGFWLYTDLPDFLSPTPKICLTTQATRLVAFIVKNYFHNERFYMILHEEVTKEFPILAQMMFFVLHIVKIVIIVAVLWSGFANPLTLNPLKYRAIPKATDLKKEVLLSIGWTGSRKACFEDFCEFHKKKKIEEAGGLIPASKAGVLRGFKNIGVALGKGEGFDTPLPTAEDSGAKALTLEKMRKLNKFKLNYDYIAHIGSTVEKDLAEKSPEAQAYGIKAFRRYGPLMSTPEVKEIVQQRTEKGNGDVTEE